MGRVEHLRSAFAGVLRGDARHDAADGCMAVDDVIRITDENVRRVFKIKKLTEDV